jgi:hypothetical protein
MQLVQQEAIRRHLFRCIYEVHRPTTFLQLQLQPNQELSLTENKRNSTIVLNIHLHARPVENMLQACTVKNKASRHRNTNDENRS